jgi:hypothetical protein
MSPRTVPTGQRTSTRQTATAQPTYDQIRRRAYELYVARKGAPGNPDADWRQAEQELRGRLTLLGKS